MWLVKGVGLGLFVFAVFFVVYFITHIAGGLRQHAAIGLSAITGSTIYRPLFWIALLLTLSASCACTKLLAR
jgi:ABC-type antimicrobial peptide transport system permease subunit